MKQITRWNDLVGKTITGVAEFNPALIMGDEYCIFEIEEWGDGGEIIISDKPPPPYALLDLGFIDKKECRKLVANKKARHEARVKKIELETLARLKAKYEEKDGKQE